MCIKSYQQLELMEQKISLLSSISSIMEWDHAVMMPSGGIEQRSRQLAMLSVLKHELSKSPARAELIEKAQSSSGDLDDRQMANLARMAYDHTCTEALTSDLVEHLAFTVSDTEFTWRRACAENDFTVLSGKFDNLLLLVREKASALGDALGLNAYDALLNLYDRGTCCADFASHFATLSCELPPLLEAALEYQPTLLRDISLSGPFDVSRQREMNRALVQRMGFDFNCGRLDESLHPFSSGIPEDVRMTTRYNEDDFIDALMASIHETGHSLYTQGLPTRWRDQPIGAANSMILHESQSLCLEMQLARSSEFLSFLAPFSTQYLSSSGSSWSSEDLGQHLCRVKRSMLRLTADEITYPLHIILRFELEQDLIHGTLKSCDLPEAWRAKMEQMLGIVPDCDRHNCLQDIHWYLGLFGYFPTYTLGAMAAAQLFAKAISHHPEIFAEARNGRVDTLIQWMRRNVHEHGSYLSAQEILLSATGKPLDVMPFLSHLRHRYLGIDT